MFRDKLGFDSRDLAMMMDFVHSKDILIPTPDGQWAHDGPMMGHELLTK